jgi:hypothetical protein
MKLEQGHVSKLEARYKMMEEEGKAFKEDFFIKINDYTE